MNKLRYYLVPLLVLFDQVTKIIVSKLNFVFDLGFFAFNLTYNTGAIWGFFQNSNLIFIWISLIALGFLIYFYDEFENGRLFYYVLISGILGNFLDRIFVGAVIDFIDFKIWPIFNFADVFISLGIVGLLFIQLNSSKSSNLSK